MKYVSSLGLKELNLSTMSWNQPTVAVTSHFPPHVCLDRYDSRGCSLPGRSPSSSPSSSPRSCATTTTGTPSWWGWGEYTSSFAGNSAFTGTHSLSLQGDRRWHDCIKRISFVTFRAQSFQIDFFPFQQPLVSVFEKPFAETSHLFEPESVIHPREKCNTYSCWQGYTSRDYFLRCVVCGERCVQYAENISKTTHNMIRSVAEEQTAWRRSASTRNRDVTKPEDIGGDFTMRPQ